MAMRKKHEPAIKARVALEALKGEKTLAQISSGKHWGRSMLFQPF